MKLNENWLPNHSKFEVTLRLTVSQSVSQCVLVSSTLVELATRYYFLSVCCCLVSVRRPLWREDGVCNLQCNYSMVRVGFSNLSIVRNSGKKKIRKLDMFPSSGEGSEWIRLALSNGPNRVSVSRPLSEDWNRSSFRNVAFSCHLNILNDGQNPETESFWVIYNIVGTFWEIFYYNVTNGSTAYCWALAEFSAPSCNQSVGLLAWGISLTQGFYLHTGQHKDRIHTGTSMLRMGFELTISVSERVKTVHASAKQLACFTLKPNCRKLCFYLEPSQNCLHLIQPHIQQLQSHL
jgi:hypothetical protein